MATEEFMKQQYLTLRDEIRTSKARVFALVVIATLFVPIAALAARQFDNTFAAVSLPFVLIVLMLAFIMEQNSIVRAGKYLKEHVEPQIDGLVTWESWLESNHRMRSADRYFFGSFLLVFMLFYVIGASIAAESMSHDFPEQLWYVVVAYGIGGLWFVVIWARHWHSCTTTN
jgi:hypothetical protein